MMLRSTRRITHTGIVGVNTDTVAALWNDGTQHTAPLRKKATNPYHMTHSFSTIHSKVLSHLLTACATALLVSLISNMYKERESMETEIPLVRSETVLRKMGKFHINERRLRRGDSDVHPNKSVPFPFYDVVVVGSGPAGLTASLFAVRAGLNVLVVGSETGLLSEATSLDNFPSWFSSPMSAASGGGMRWLETTKLQAVAAGVHFARSGFKVSKIVKGQSNVFSLNISGNIVDSVSVILATGATGRKLNLPNEELLWGKSIHSCAICDGSSYQNKTVIVVGGGDAAIDAAILLSRHARDVVVIHRRETFRASNQRNIKALLAIPKISVKTPFVVAEFLLQDNAISLSGVRIRNTLTNETVTLLCDGAFIMIGSTPNTQFLNNFVDLNDEGFIDTSTSISDASTRTSMEGVFAAGEVSDNQYKQAITAAAAGARAAIDAERWLRQQLPDVEFGIQRRIPEYIPLQLFSNDRPSVAREILSNHAEPTTERNSNLECSDFTNVDCVKASVAGHPVVMFSKSSCPYCVQALEMLKMEGAQQSAILVINIDGLDEDKIRSNLENMSGRRTVPNIFIGGRNIGGLVLMNRLQKLGELRTILEKANAIQPNSAVECNDFRRIDCIEAAVHKYPVVVFSKSWCPYCKKALEALSIEGVTSPPFILVVNIDELDAQSIQSNLARLTGRRTVPNVFIGGYTIGGGDETVQLHGTGVLRTLLVNAKAIAES
jgi:thioredoxin reductase (NADPH)